MDYASNVVHSIPRIEAAMSLPAPIVLALTRSLRDGLQTVFNTLCSVRSDAEVETTGLHLKIRFRILARYSVGFRTFQNGDLDRNRVCGFHLSRLNKLFGPGQCSSRTRTTNPVGLDNCCLSMTVRNGDQVGGNAAGSAWISLPCSLLPLCIRQHVPKHSLSIVNPGS